MFITVFHFDFVVALERWVVVDFVVVDCSNWIVDFVVAVVVLLSIAIVEPVKGWVNEITRHARVVGFALYPLTFAPKAVSAAGVVVVV